MTFLKILRLFFFFIPLSVFSQNVQENLDYINAQFAQFNNFKTSFQIDAIGKKIVCQDQFGIYTANFEDVEFRIDAQKTGVEIFCLDESAKCISSVQKDGTTGLGFERYSMELLQNNKLIPNVDVVIEKFSSIKAAVLVMDPGAVNDKNNSSRNQVELHIQRLNAIFREHSQYKNIWFLDWDNQMLIGKTASCEVQVPIVNMTVEYFERENVQKFRNGFVFKTTEKNILEKCTDLENRVSTTHEYLDSLKYAEDVVNSFRIIQDLVSSKTMVASSGNSKISIEQNLSYINSQFEKYNIYHTRFFVDTSKKELVWIQDFGESRAPIDQIDFLANIENAWLVIRCKDGNSCVSSTSPQGRKMQYDEYSMSLMEYDSIIPHMDEVIQKFKELAEAVLNNP